MGTVVVTFQFSERITPVGVNTPYVKILISIIEKKLNKNYGVLFL